MTPRILAHAPVLSLLALAGCLMETPVHPLFPTVERQVCMMTETSVFTPPANNNGEHGFSVAVATWGQTSTNMNSVRTVVSGAPAIDRVRLSEANAATGLIDTTSTTRNQTLAPPTGLPTERQFGFAVHAADIRGCANAFPYNGCGEEILVGAPDTGGIDKGLVNWYQPTGASTGSYIHGGTITPRVGLPGAAEFGASFASFSHLLNVEQPWLVAPDHPGWVAIGAPGADKVEIYTITPGNANPFTYVQTLSSPVAGRRFGHALVSGDFNADGIGDLAVGAPDPDGADVEGRVFVYRGDTTTPGPLRTAPLELNGFDLSGTTTGGVQDDAFGWSLAAGPFTGGQLADRASLIVGAPTNDFEWDPVSETIAVGDLQQGGVCTFVLSSDSSPSGLGVDSRDCWLNPWSFSRTTTNENFGFAVEVGNYVNMDDHGTMDTTSARLHEIAISVPGYDHDNGTTVLTDAGEVAIFLTDDNGLNIESLGQLVAEFPGESANARFGESLADGYIQASGWEDLAIGAPQHRSGANLDGRTTLTQAIDTSSCAEITGTWEFEDANGDPVQLMISPDISGNLHLVLVNDVAAEIRDSSNNVCVADWGTGTETLSFDLPARLDIALTGTWECDETTKTWENVSADGLIIAVLEASGLDTTDPFVAGFLSLFGPQTMDITLTLDDSGPTPLLDIDINTDDIDWATLETYLSIDDSCRLVDQPWQAEQLVEGICEA